MKRFDRNLTLFLEGLRKIDGGIEALYLFGSRARGRPRPSSDYDVLVVVTKRNKELKAKLYDAAVEVFLKTGADVSLKILGHQCFERQRALRSPFIEHVLQEGVKLEPRK